MERGLNSRGFTLVEMVVVMAIFVIVIMVTNGAFESIVGKASQQTRAAQSNIEGVIGLEILRADLDAAGFGLPWTIPVTLPTTSYVEADSGVSPSIAGIDPASTDFNDARSVAPNTNPPRALLSKTADSGSDYLVIKSTAVGMANSAKRWSYVTYSASSGIIKSWPTSTDNLETGARVISVDTTFTTAGKAQRQLVVKSDGTFWFRKSGGTAPVDFSPADPSQSFVIYGLFKESASSDPVRMPFNRAEYFVHRPADVAARCASGTGNLYKAPIAHSDGKYPKLYPLLECVLDMQVVVVRDVDNNGVLTHATGDTLLGLNAEQIREQVKMVKVYILAQEGQKDKSFTYPATSIVNGPLDMPSIGRTWSAANLEEKVGSDWKNYRWRVYEVAVQPRNLNR